LASVSVYDALSYDKASTVRYDAYVPRTTLTLEDDAMRAAKAHAKRHRMTLGQAVSDLVRKGNERPLVTDQRSGLRVLRLGRRSPRVTAARVEELLDELP
jgi:hypothetical protein